MLSLSTQHKRIYFLDFTSNKDLLFSMRLKPENKIIVIDTSLINSSL
jgi:hypothetical protein